MHDSTRGRRVQACLGVEAAGGSRDSLWVFFQPPCLAFSVEPTRCPSSPARGQVTQSMTQASRSPGLLFSFVGREWGRRGPLRVPDEAVGGIENLLICAQSIELAHHGGHPACCVEHRFTHLRRQWI